MDEPTGEKKHAPTELRRKRAWEEGKIPRSRDLATGCSLLATVSLLWFSGPRLVSGLVAMLENSFQVQGLRVASPGHGDVRQATLASFDPISGLSQAMQQSLWLLLPLMAGTIVVSLSQGWLQSGFSLFSGSVAPDWSRLNPLYSATQLFSFKNLHQFGATLLKSLLILLTVSMNLYSRSSAFLAASSMSGIESAGFIWSTLIGIGFQVAFVLILWGIVDYGIHWWHRDRDLQMSDEELRHELKETSTDPALVGRRHAQRAAMRQPNASSSSETQRVMVESFDGEWRYVLRMDPDSEAPHVERMESIEQLSSKDLQRNVRNTSSAASARLPSSRADTLLLQSQVGQPIDPELYEAVAPLFNRA
ncbi:MAG: EscU/YscU/HrcU family type III secretion system export apparatus switch protein [Pirellulaceae bacterium]